LRQPMMKGINYKSINKELINADSVMQRGVLLPLHHGMTDSMYNRLHENITNFIKISS